MANILITGGSRGLGHGFACGLPEAGDLLWIVSRGEPHSMGRTDGVTRRWIQADLRDEQTPAQIAAALGDTALDLLLYNAGVWESSAFTPRYDFTQVTDQETRDLITINLTAVILLVKALMPPLRRAAHPKIVLIGSINGMDNNLSREVAYNASKAGLRGLGQTLRRGLRDDGIPVTVINPGSIDTRDWDEGAEAVIARSGRDLLPMQDIVALLRTIMQLSPAACVMEIDLPAVGDAQV